MEESKRGLQQTREEFCKAGLDPISTTRSGPWSEYWNCKDPVRPEIANVIEERQEVTPSRTEEDRSEEKRNGDEEDEKYS